jgi:hypothetical protein
MGPLARAVRKSSGVKIDAWEPLPGSLMFAESLTRLAADIAPFGTFGKCGLTSEV